MDVNVVVGMKDRPSFFLLGVDDIGDGSDFSLSYGYRWRWISLWGGLVRDDLGVGFKWGDPEAFPLQLIGKWWDDGSGAWSLEGRLGLMIGMVCFSAMTNLMTRARIDQGILQFLKVIGLFITFEGIDGPESLHMR